MLQIVRAIESIRDASGGRIIGWNAALHSQWSGSRDIFSTVSSLMRTMLRRIGDAENFPRDLRLLIVIDSRPYSY